MAFIPILVSVFLLTQSTTNIGSTEQMLQAMQKRYKGKWAKSITFTQYNTHYAADTIKNTSVWYEAIEYPGNFRIDFGDPSEGNAVIFAQDSVFSFKEGQLKARKAQANNLMLLTGGIFFMPIEQVLIRLKQEGYDWSHFREDTWEGQPAYVVGAASGDTLSDQFWISKEHLTLLRTISQTPDHHVQEGRFRKHIRLGGGWIETEVLFLKDGQRQQLEEYKHIQLRKTLSPELFQPEHFGKVHWLKKE